MIVYYKFDNHACLQPNSFLTLKNDIHMKAFFRILFISFCFISSTQVWSNPDKTISFSSTILSNVTGNIWVEVDENNMYNGETGPSGVLVLLYDNEEDTLVSQSISFSGKYEFNGVAEGKYYMRIDESAFQLGGPLLGLQSCPGTNDANDMIDNDDNGTDTTPNDVLCSPFNLIDTDPMSNVSIEYIDFCFYSACDELNPLALPSCGDILTSDFICDISDLDNFCALMPTDSSAGIQPSPLCDGINSSENISWLAFVASDGLYSINISPMDCQFGDIGQQGIQVGIYTDCTFSETVFCSDQCSINNISIGSNLLNPGQVYYLYINGCNGNVCSYQIDINGSPIIPSLEPNDVCVFSGGSFQCEDISYCPNADILIQGQGISLSGSFTWSITTISGDPYLGDSIVNTSENALILNLPSEGKYNVCLTDVENGCIDQAWSGVKCREISTTFSIPMPMDEDFGESFVCEDDLDDFSINVFASVDPNGDGDSGWNAAIPDYMIGLNESTAYTDGCSYEQQFTLSVFPLTPVEDVLLTVCEEDLPVQVDALTITTFIFNGQQSFTLFDYLLVNSADQYGCDSIINLTIEKLNILQGALFDPICTVDGILLQFDYIEDLSTDASFLDFVWTDPFGNIIPNGADPKTILAPFEGGNGEYTLEITINKNGKSCIYSYSTFVEIATFLPPTPIISGPSTVCSGESMSVYIAEGSGDEISFIWSFPNDVASTFISGTANEVITIDWTGSNGGDVTAIGQNICGQSDQSSYDVQIIPKTTPNFSIDTSTCIDIPATIDFIGTGINLVDYTWDFDGGIVISGSGMGPYEVSWDSPGDKLVTLVTIDMNGCFSNPVVKFIPVKFPLAPTQVNCIPSLGEIEFTWEIPLMVSGFEVNVLSGQTGGVFTANSFTISGLAAGEEVTIELLTIPEDPICGEFVSTTISCVSQDCVPPTIELIADEDLCVDSENITIDVTILSGEMGTGVFSGPGIVDPTNGIFDPSVANLGINTILYTFISNISGCLGTITISIEVFDSPVSSFTQDRDTMCVTDVISLDYTGTINADIYDWGFDGGVGSGLITDQEVQFSSAGIKTISLEVSKNGCVSSLFTSTVLVEPELEDILIQCDSVSTDIVVFSWNAINGVTLFEITIDNNPSFFSPNTSITIDELEEDQEVTITINALSNTTCPGTSASSLCKTTKTVSVEGLALSKLKIFPNPINDIVYIDGEQNNSLSYSLYSIIGRSIDNGNLKTNFIDVSKIPSGLYILRITDENDKIYKDFKVVKE